MGSYRVTHKEWDLRDDCTEFILSVSSYSQLAWEPSAAQVTKSYSAVYPHLNDFTGKLNYCYLSQST